MIEAAVPVIRIMTLQAIMGEIVFEMIVGFIVVLFVARPAIRGRAVIDTADMAVEAIRLQVRTG